MQEWYIRLIKIWEKQHLCLDLELNLEILQ